MLSNIAYHIFNALETIGEFISELFTDKATIRRREISNILKKLGKCYDEVFAIIFNVFQGHLDARCDQLLSKVTDRTDIYIVGLQRQLSELNKPLSEAEKQVYNIAIEKLEQLDNQCAAVRLQIEEYSRYLKSKPSEEVQSADKNIEAIEIGLRKLINSRLVAEFGTNEAKKIIPSHLQPKLDERIQKWLRDHPNTPPGKFKTLESQLQFCDMTEYLDIISNKHHWQYFAGAFNSQDNLKKHLIQISGLRNAIRHSREITPLILQEGIASILWFKMALKIKEVV
jgi:hypothetical protein